MQKVRGWSMKNRSKCNFGNVEFRTKSTDPMGIRYFRAEYERPDMKDGKVILLPLRQPYHYIGEMVKAGYVSNQPRMGSNVVLMLF